MRQELQRNSDFKSLMLDLKERFAPQPEVAEGEGGGRVRAPVSHPKVTKLEEVWARVCFRNCMVW